MIKCLKVTFINNLFFLYIKLIKKNNKIIMNLFDLAYNSILIVMILSNNGLILLSNKIRIKIKNNNGIFGDCNL